MSSNEVAISPPGSGLSPNSIRPEANRVLGEISKMGQRDIRRLLIIGAMAVVRSASRKGALEGSWPERAAAMYTLIATAKLNRVDPQAWLADVPAHQRSQDHRPPSAATVAMGRRSTGPQARTA